MSATTRQTGNSNCGASGCCPEPYYCPPPPAFCFPSVCDVTKQSECVNGNFGPGGTQMNWCDYQKSEFGTYGASKAPPCGINMEANCAGCCWDSTLCFPLPEECSPGENVVTIPAPQQVPTISADAAAALAIYNYSLQNVISRGLKFVASYYDWLYCQIGLYQYKENNGQDDHGPPQRFVVEGSGSEAPGTQNLPYVPCRAGATIIADGKPAHTLAPNAGNAYTPPASLFAQVAQVLGWADTTFGQVDLAQCVCNNLCQFIQMLINIEGSSVIRDFIKDSAFNGAVSNYQATYLGCGNLYDEGKLVDFGEQVVSVIDLMVAVLKNLGVDDQHADDGEALLQKLCLCLARAASGGTCNSTPQCGAAPIGNLQNFPPTNLASTNLSCCPKLQESTWNELIVGAETDDIAFCPVVINYNSQIYRQQFFTMFVDLLQFILFDRDCNPDNFQRSADCGSCCPQPPSQEEWLKSRCRIGTGNGSCVVCSGVCAGFRRKDNYKPLVSSLMAVRYAISLITLDRSDVAGSSPYHEQVATLYNGIVSDFTNLYKDQGASLVFHPDCAAPQFCCSTQLAAEKCDYNCCTGMCENVPGCCLFPIPVIDTRKATWCCGQGVPYLPSLGQWVNTLCFDTNGSVTEEEEATTTIRYDCFSNPCVIMPYCCNSITCDKTCCDYGANKECDFFATA